VKVFFLMMLVQFIAYFNLTINFRAIAHNHLPVAMVTDGLAVIITIFVVQRVSNPDKPVRWGWQESGMVIGGSLAAWAGLTLTRTWG
jgi:hypothetical protein